MRAKKSVSMKVVVLILAIVLLVGAAAGGTLAWLIASTNTVTNTFTVGDINIDLTETVNGEIKSALTTAVTNNGFKMVPGTDLSKNPKVTVKANSEDCWLFIKVDAQNGVVLEGKSGSDDYITYVMADGWTAVSGANGVYCREVSTSTTDQEFDVLKDNKVHVLDTVTKAMMETAKTSQPTLTFTAYAVQKANGASTFTAAQAWDIAVDGQLTN